MQRYSASNSVYTMRARANLENEALSQRMLTNGFFARMIVLESGKRGKGQDPKIIEVPERILATAKGWADRTPGEAGLAEIHPRPRIVGYTKEAKRLQEETRAQVEQEYGMAENASDPVGTAVWGRADELVRKLSLIHAVSVAPQEPVITAEAVRWAAALVLHQSRRMLYMARVHVADNPFHAACLKLLGKLRKAPGQQLAHQTLLKRMKMDARSFRDLVATLVQRGEIGVEKKETQTRPGVHYRLREAR